jgi:hypothetical protein
LDESRENHPKSIASKGKIIGLVHVDRRRFKKRNHANKTFCIGKK